MDDHFLYKLFNHKFAKLIQPMGNQRNHNISKYGNHKELSEYTENYEISSMHIQTMTYSFRTFQNRTEQTIS